jgi:hypothetical protein
MVPVLTGHGSGYPYQHCCLKTCLDMGMLHQPQNPDSLFSLTIEMSFIATFTHCYFGK